MLEETASVRILEEVAETKGVDANDLDPLYGYIEPDALDALLSHGFTGELTFQYEDCEVTVSGDGEIEVANGHTIR